MLTIPAIPVLRRTIDHLRRPFIQRLITLVVSAILAMSLVHTTSVLALPLSGHEVASYTTSQAISATHLGASFMPNAYGLHATEKQRTERRFV